MNNKLTSEDLQFIIQLLYLQMNINYLSCGDQDSPSYRKLKDMRIRATNNLLELEENE